MKLQTIPMLLALLAPGVLQAGEPQAAEKASMPGHMMLKAKETQWGEAPAALPKGAQAVVLAGDPGKEGVFTIRLKVPAGYRVPRHWHPSDEAVTLIEGDVTLSMGEAANAHTQTLAPGDFVYLPARMQHEPRTQGGAVFQVQSIGPFQVNYVDPNDDPRNAAAALSDKAKKE